MREIIISESTDDFADGCPTTLYLRYNVREVLKAMCDHVTHAATRDKPFIFRMSSKLKTKKILCPKCKYDNIIPVLYGYMDGDEFEDHKQLLKLEQEGKIDLPGCDATNGYNLRCKGCGHSWEWKLGYDWGKIAFNKE
jgi:hypothetical protein